MSAAVEPAIKSIRGRALLVGLLWVPVVSYATANASVSNIFSLLSSAVGALLITIALNALTGKVTKRVPLTPTDLILIFVIVSTVATISAEWTTVAHSSIHGLALQAKTNPLVRETMLPNMPDWLAVKDRAPVEDMLGGSRGMGYVIQKIPLFLPKYLGWAAIFALICGSMLCLNSLMRGAWAGTEKLPFPLIQLPIEMAQGRMFKSRAMWIAFGVMFAIDLLNGLNYLFPNLPSIPVKEYIDIQNLFKDPPLSNMGEFHIALYPFMAAIAFFMPNDLTFSLILFFLMRKVTHVALAAHGIPQSTFSGTAIIPGPPYWDEQTWGATIAMFCSALYFGRNYLKQVWSDIKTGARSEDGGISHRWGLAGLVACFAGLVGLGMYAGLPPHWLVLYFGLMLIFGAVLSRLRAQLGPPTHEFAFFGPNAFMYRFFGNNWFSDKSAVMLSGVFVIFNRIHRTNPMPNQLESIKMTRDRKVNQKQVFWVIFGVTVAGVLFAYFFRTALAYRTLQPYASAEGESYLRALKNNPHGPEVTGMLMTALGFLIVLGLDFVRLRVPGFPIHPAGYLLAMNYGVDYYWFGLMIALLIKIFITRYHGLRGYDKLRDVALGILLAEYAAELLWMTMALITHQSTYTISFNDRGLGIQ